MQFFWNIIYPRFLLASKVELGMLARDIPYDVRSDRGLTVPGRSELRVMTARILAASPRRAMTEEDLTQPPVVH